MKRLLTLKEINTYFDTDIEDSDVLPRMKFMTVSQIWEGRQFYIVENANTFPQIKEILVVRGFSLDVDGINVHVRRSVSNEDFLIGYVPVEVYRDILVSVPSNCIIAKQIWCEDNGGHTSRLCAGLMFKQPSDPCNHKYTPALVEDRRMGDTYDRETVRVMKKDFMASIA